MKSKNRPRFDMEALRDLAGGKVFARGEEYFRDGQVELIAVESARVLARVTGSEDYRTELTGRGKDIDGECSCRAFEDWGFCKHMVATALAANAAGPSLETEGARTLCRIRDHLKGKGVEALAEMIMGLAERDRALFRKLELEATVADPDENALGTRLRKAIDGATRTGDFIEYGEAASWAEGVDAVLNALAELASRDRSGLALELAERAIDRIEHAAGSIDDSSGHCGALLERAGAIHVAACEVARPESTALARKLFAREMEGGYNTFYRPAVRYADVLGEEGLDEYRRLAHEAWEKLPEISKIRRPRHVLREEGYDRLRDILDFFAERDGDVDARIALRAKDLSSPRAYLQLAEFCFSQGRCDDALRRAEEGLWMFEDEQPDEGLVLLAADLLAKAGRESDAERQLWGAFEKAPSLDLYTHLRRAGDAATRDRALRLIETRLIEKHGGIFAHIADLFVRILMREEMFDAAWAALRRYGPTLSVKDELAAASVRTHPGEALKVYQERVERLANAGGNPAYQQAVKLIGRIAKLQTGADHASYVTALKLRFHRKRNFISLLG